MNLKAEIISKRFLILQVLIFILGFGFLFICVLLNLPASNDTALLGLKAIIFMILFVVNTSSNSLYSSEFYYVNKCECDNKNFTNADDAYNSEDIKNKQTVSAQKLLYFNIWILNSSFFLIFSILINIIQSVGKLSGNSILKILSFYSFLIFLIAMIVNYIIFNCSFYKSLKKIIQGN